MRLFAEPKADQARIARLPPPVGGFTTSKPFMQMKPLSAGLMENFYPFPDRLEMRQGYSSHATGFSEIPLRLWNYASGANPERLFATTDDGIYDISSPGAVGAAAAVLTNGKTSAVTMSTGAAFYFICVNGVDDLVRYDGSTWTTVATFGSVNTEDLSYVEVYRQRLFFAIKNSLRIAYLPINSISGSAVTYDMGAIFRQGGEIIAMGTWTLDGGAGPEDQLAVVSSKGEIAVFAGSDPTSPASWGLRGVYFIGKPLGERPLYKYGGDLLFISENGLYPLSAAVQSSSIDRVRAVTEEIRQYFNDSARDFGSFEGWQVFAMPDIPLLLVNIPSEPNRRQVIMHAQTGAWGVLKGWNAYAFARINTTVYFSSSDTVWRVGGASDNGANITSTLIQAHTDFGYPLAKQVTMVRPFFVTEGNFNYTLGVTDDFRTLAASTALAKTDLAGTSLWGSGVWGTAVWGGTSTPLQEWQTIPDKFSVFKAFYMQLTSRVASVQYQGVQLQYLAGANPLD